LTTAAPVDNLPRTAEPLAVQKLELLRRLVDPATWHVRRPGWSFARAPELHGMVP
jgi:hypothetical protein